MKTFTVDGVPCEMSDTAFAVVQKVLGQFDATKDDLATANTKLGEFAATVSTKDGEIAALKKQVEDAKMTPAQLDAAVRARSGVIADAKAILGKEPTTDGKTDIDIKREAVSVKLGDDAKAMDDAAIGGAFNVLAKSTGRADPVRDVVRDGIQTRDTSDLRRLADEARLKRDQALRDGHLHKAA